MKLLFCEPNPSFGGGSEQVCLDLARGLARRGHRISLLHDQAGTMLAAYEAAGATRRQMELRPFGWRTLGSSLLRAWRVGRAASSLGAEVIVASEVHYLRLLALASVMSGIPVLFHLGLAATHCEWSWASAYRTIRAGVAPSAHTLESWRDSGWPATTLSEIPNGVDTARFCPAPDKAALRARLGLPVNATLINHTGRLTPEKGTGTLIEAFARIKDQLPNSFLVMVGNDGVPGDRWPRRAAELGIPAERVKFLGARPDPEAFMAAADVVVAPSECEESFGLTVVEAMACGVPVITTEVGMLPQLLGPGQADRVVRSGDGPGLAQAIHRAVSAAPERSRALRARVLEHFSTDKSCDAYERVLLQLRRPQPAGGVSSLAGQDKLPVKGGLPF